LKIERSADLDKCVRVTGSLGEFRILTGVSLLVDKA
jgi:hypothetical protein